MTLSLCVFCGSSVGNDPDHVATARELGRRLADNGIRLVYGGGRIGLMGVTAEAALANGGHVVGVIPRFLRKAEIAHEGLDELIAVDSMHARKQRMFELSDAVAVLPGGMGTLDETIEVVTWKQLRLHDKPIFLVNDKGYWDRFRDLVAAIIGAGFAPETSAGLFSLVASPEQLIGELLALAGR